MTKRKDLDYDDLARRLRIAYEQEGTLIYDRRLWIPLGPIRKESFAEEINRQAGELFKPDSMERAGYTKGPKTFTDTERLDFIEKVGAVSTPEGEMWEMAPNTKLQMPLRDSIDRCLEMANPPEEDPPSRRREAIAATRAKNR